ncbi:MAG: glycerol-3-phosphate responsive antiterminator [Syntrophothermus sp.]
MELFERLKKRPVIGGIKQPEDLPVALEDGLEVLFFLTGTIFDLREMVAETRNRKKLAFVHIDLLEGIGKDRVGVRFLAEEIGVKGILTTRTQLVRAAKEQGLIAIQRLFMLDSEALKTGIHVTSNARPDAVEILPALILPNIIGRLPLAQMPPVIGGGLVETPEELKAILGARGPGGERILAVSTSSKDLWKLRW